MLNHYGQLWQRLREPNGDLEHERVNQLLFDSLELLQIFRLQHLDGQGFFLLQLMKQLTGLQLDGL